MSIGVETLVLTLDPHIWVLYQDAMITKFFKDHPLGVLLVAIIATVVGAYAYDLLKSRSQQPHISVNTLGGKDVNGAIVKARILEGPNQLKHCVTFDLKLINHGLSISDEVRVSYFLPPSVKISEGIGVASSEFPPYTRNVQWQLIAADSQALRAGYSPVIPFYLGFAPDDQIPKSFEMGLVLYTDHEILYRGNITLEVSVLATN